MNKFGLYETIATKKDLPIAGFDDAFISELKEHRIIKGYPEGHSEANAVIELIENINNKLRKITKEELQDVAGLKNIRIEYNNLVLRFAKNDSLTDDEIFQIQNRLDEINTLVAGIILKVGKKRDQKTNYEEKYKNLRPEDYQLN